MGVTFKVQSPVSTGLSYALSSLKNVKNPDLLIPRKN